MKGGFTKLFGHVPKVAILEAFAQNFDFELTATEIREISGISKRATYLIISRLVKDGVLLEKKSRPKLFSLNMNDVRAKTLAIIEPMLELGDLESLMKEEMGLPQSSLLPGGIENTLTYKEFEKPDNYEIINSDQAGIGTISSTELKISEGNGTGEIYPIASAA